LTDAPLGGESMSAAAGRLLENQGCVRAAEIERDVVVAALAPAYFDVLWPIRIRRSPRAPYRFAVVPPGS
jgi:hypothetical protein